MHQQAAIDMSETELKNGKDFRMKRLAKSIIAAQEREIARSDKFLSQQRSENKSLPLTFTTEKRSLA